MDFLKDFGDWLTDDRLITNLIGVHVLLAALLLVSVIIRRIITQGGVQLIRWTGLHFLDGFSKEAVRHARTLLFWATVGLMLATAVGGIIYHLAGRDMRADALDWYNGLTAREVFEIGLGMGELVILGISVFVGLRLVNRLKRRLETYALEHLPHKAPLGLEAVDSDGKPVTEEEHKRRHEYNIKHWFHLLERFVVCVVVLGAAWMAGHIVGLGGLADAVIGFGVRVLAILMVSRLLVLACRTMSHFLAELGNRHLRPGKFVRYWERVTRLFPFGEKCFEAAVYITVASLCVDELKFTKKLYDPSSTLDLGPKIVLCIGIFFITRVLIELLTVLLNEAFNMYEDDRPTDQMGKTLVPLLQSVCQYGLYFGSGLMMMHVMGLPTTSIVAATGILGLAVGLGAQSLVTDVVSGFFILFENQYLVGDIVQICDAQGRVEAISIRHTQVRDEQGKLYIIPNGQIKSVMNYSKGYVNAIVDLKVPTSTPLDQVMHDMAEAGRRLGQTRREVLAETVVKGLVDLTPSDMVIRAVTRVQPGSHLAMQNEFRRLLKGVFDERTMKPTALAA